MAVSGRRGGGRGRGDGDKDRDDRDPDRHREHGSREDDEAYDNPAEHLEIERRRFAGGLQPTPQLYALAREQWYRLPGVVSRPSMDTVIGEPASGHAQAPDRAHSDGKEPGQ